MLGKKIKAFLRGMWEFRLNCTWADPMRDELCTTELDDCYEWGREWAHRLTFRRYDG